MRRLRSIATRRGVATSAVLAVVIGVGAGAAMAQSDEQSSDLAAARRATARFHLVERAVADERFELADLDGLTCIEDPGGSGGMGVHYVKGGLVGDGEIDVAHPEALIYDPSGPEPRLVAVEYVVLVADWGELRDPPTLFGRELRRVDSPNRFGLPPFYELHAWIWQPNPSGMFEDWNPRIDC